MMFWRHIKFLDLSSIFNPDSNALFFHSCARSVTHGDNKALWCVCVCMCRREGGSETQRESGAGSRGERRRWSRQSTGVAVAVRWTGWGGGGVDSDGGPAFNRDVRRDKDGPDRPAEWSRRDRAALLSIPYTALSIHCSLPSHSGPLSCCINLFHQLVTMLRLQFDVSEFDVCVHIHVKAPFESFHRGRKRYSILLFKKMSLTSRDEAGWD